MSRATSRLRFVTGLASAVHAFLALACYGLYACDLLGLKVEKWVVIACFVSAVPGMIGVCILFDRAVINMRSHATAAERRVARARVYGYTGSSSWPWPVGVAVAFAFAVLALLAPSFRGHAALLSLFALFHVIPAVVLFHAFRWLGKTARPSDPIPSR